METAGWTQAETARRLHMSSGGVNQIVKGTVRPSPQTLALLVRVVADEKPEALKPTRYPDGAEGVISTDPPELREQFDQLRKLHEKDKDAFNAASVVINQFSSKVDTVYRTLVKRAVAKVERDAQERRKKPKADDHPGKT